MNLYRLRYKILSFATVAIFLFLPGCREQAAKTTEIAARSQVPTILQETSAASSKAVSTVTSSQAVLSSKSESQMHNSSVADVSSKPVFYPVKLLRPATEVPASSEADASFLNDAVFVGDSVTLKLKNFVTYRRKANPEYFGKAGFLAAGSMGSGNALQPLSSGSIHPLYNGEKSLLEDSAAAMGAKKIYLMLGINDIALYGIEDSAENLEKLALRFLAKQPDAVLYIQSATPIIRAKQRNFWNNENLDRYNYKVSEICKKHEWNYLDIASVMRESDGSLKPEYCSDPNILGIHFTDRACDVWIQYILTHTGK